MILKLKNFINGKEIYLIYLLGISFIYSLCAAGRRLNTAERGETRSRLRSFVVLCMVAGILFYFYFAFLSTSNIPNVLLS